MIESGSNGKYLLYAIGEIALVVIGILIALQVNNWNVRNQEHTFQQTILKEIRSSLILDREYVGSHIPHRMSYAKNALAFFNRILLDKVVDRDSSDFHFRRIENYYQVTLNRGPYDALKFSGVDKIKNDSLRNHLIYVYDYIYPRYEGFLLSTSKLDFDRQNELIKALRKKWSPEIENDRVHVRRPGIKKINFHTNQDFLELIDIIDKRVDWTEDNVDEFLVYIDDLISHMDAIIEW